MNWILIQEKLTYLYLILSIIYISLYYFIADLIIINIPNGFELSILLLIISGTYTVKFTLEQIKNYFKDKKGIFPKIFEIFFGLFLIFLLDLIPFIIDFKNNKFSLIVGLSLIILFSVQFILMFILQPIYRLYFAIKLNNLEKEKNKELQEVDKIYQEKIKEINNS